MALKTYLKYAESGILDIPQVSGNEFDSPFEEAVFMRLIELGYDVKPQVGSAGFCIDLAVVDSESPGRFLLGIECDGATYHSARSARDRDRLRQEVLEGLGWRIHRIWSTDWFRNPDRELKRVLEAIEKSKIYVKSSKKEDYAVNEILRHDINDHEVIEDNIKYTTAKLNIDLAGREFTELPIGLLVSWVYEVIKVESPVHKNEVMKRVCDALGIKRIGNKIQDKFIQSFRNLNNTKQIGDYIWLNDMNVPVLRDRSDLSTKKFEYIAKEEIAEAIKKVVLESFGIEIDHLMTLSNRKLGFARVTDEMRIVLGEVINSLVKQKALIIKGDIYSIP